MPQSQESNARFKHIIPIQIRFNDIDALGHVNNSIYLQYMDLGKAEYIAATLVEAFTINNETLVIANINCDFCRITLFGEKIAVMTRVAGFSEHTITLEQKVVNVDTCETKAMARTVMVGYNARQNAKMPIPQLWVDRIQKYEALP